MKSCPHFLVVAALFASVLLLAAPSITYANPAPQFGSTLTI